MALTLSSHQQQGLPVKLGEQATMFFRDPSGNALEFKTFRDKSMIFAH